MREERIAVRRTARVYVIASATVPGETSALAPGEFWVACHGYGQLAAGFAKPLEELEESGRLVVVPEALNRFYLDPVDRPASARRVGATWMTREDRQVEIQDAIDYLDVVHRQFVADAIPSCSVAFGFSQGAATVCRWAVHGRRRITHLVLWGAGFPHDLDWAIARRRLRDVPILLVAGRSDAHMNGLVIERQCALADEHGLSLEIRMFDGGHHLSRDALADVSAWVSEA